MTMGKPFLLGSLVLAAASLTSCVSMLGGQPVKVRPVESMSGLMAAQSDPLYEGAVTAINARDYARALDYLQQAKAGDPKDVKVLNALGVVYDKLGRFDLSARYYGQAQAVDPNSRIVAANLEYSKVLQGWQDPGQHRSIAASALPGGQSTPVAQSLPVPPTAETLADRTQPDLTQPATFINVHPAQISAPEIVAPVPVETEKKATVIADTHASVPSIVPSSQWRSFALMTPPEIVPEKVSGIAAFPAEPALPAPVPPKLPAPTKAESVSPIQQAAPVPDSANRPAVLPIRAMIVAPSIHSAAIRIAALAGFPRVAPEPAMRKEKVTVPAPAVVAQNVVSKNRPIAVLPHAVAFVAPAAHIEKKQLAAQPAPAAFRSLKPKVDARTPTLAAFRKSPTPITPVNAALVTSGNGKVLTIGKPVKILNASGRPGGIGTVSHRLAALGWSVRPFDWRMQPATTLYYPIKNIVAAKAMLRTLPFPARFIVDNDDSFAMRLVIGHDFLSWNPRNPRLADLWQKGPVIASLQRPLIRGVR